MKNLETTTVIVLMRCQVGSSHISESAAYQDVRHEMLLSADAGETNSGGQTVGAPLEPRIVGVTVSNNTGEREAGRSVSRGKRLAAFPKFAVRSCVVRILTIGRHFDGIGHNIRCAHSLEGSEASICRMGRASS